MPHFQGLTPGASSSLSKTVMERAGCLRSPVLERNKSFRSLLSERTDSLRSMTSPIMERKESLISLLIERTDSLRSLATPIVERAMSVRNLLFVPKKSVTFGNIHNRVHRVLSRDEYSKKEIDAAFYWRGDYDRMKKKRRSAENLLEKSPQDVTEDADDEDEDTDCLYGLETKAEAVAKSSLVTKSIMAVFAEQKMQRSIDKTTDPDLLASIYFKFSASSHNEAHERALKLEVSVRRYIAPCSRWSPALRKSSRKSSTFSKSEHRRRPTFAKQLSAPALPAAAPIPPVRESSFRWRASKQPIREPSKMGKSEHRPRPTFAKQMSAPERVLLPSAAPIQPVRESSFRWRAPKQPTREPSFEERRTPKTGIWAIQDSLPQATLSG